MPGAPLQLAPDLAPSLSAFDRAGKIGRGLEKLGPVGGRDVVLVDGDGGLIAAALGAAGARVTHVPLSQPLRLPVPDASADVVIGAWTAFRGVDAAEMAEVDRVLRPDGRLLVLHDYGRDDVSTVAGERPEYGPWSHRNGPFLTGGFRVRVIHCFWEFESIPDAGAFLHAAFGERADGVAGGLKRPRLSHNVAIYHRSRS